MSSALVKLFHTSDFLKLASEKLLPKLIFLDCLLKAQDDFAHKT